MRIIIDPSKYELLSFVQGVKADPESWEGWHCLQIEMPEFSDKELRQLHANAGLLLTSVLPETGSAFFSGRNEILVLCKNTSEAKLKELGQQIQNLAYAENGRGANFTIFDVRRDADHLTSSYSWQNMGAEGKGALDIKIAQACLPDIRAGQESPRNNCKVLLVEDDPVTRWLVRTALKDECLLATAQDAGKALASYGAYKPDMVLLDINLPDKSGHDVMAALKKADPSAWIVMFSSQDSLENISHALENGAKGFIAKPFRREKILRYIKECAAGR